MRKITRHHQELFAFDEGIKEYKILAGYQYAVKSNQENRSCYQTDGKGAFWHTASGKSLYGVHAHLIQEYLDSGR